MKPKIGITVSQTLEGSLRRLWNGTSLTYARGVLQAGGLPVFLPVLHGTQSLQLETLDGVLFSGGVDVDPEYFGQDHEAGLGEIDPKRDEFELELYALARAAKKPILGVCRGFQLINVAEGGTLYQHLPNVAGIWADHAQTAAPPAYGHRARLAAGSKLEQAYGSEAIRINSFHHQGVKDPAPGLTVNAWSPDGLVEGLEADGLLAVQWHPEMMFEAHAEHLAPFKVLVGMCQETMPKQGTV
jgi:putative glutamine amidotransferase